MVGSEVGHSLDTACVLGKITQTLRLSSYKTWSKVFLPKSILTAFQLLAGLTIFLLSIKLANALTPSWPEKYCSTRIIWGLGPAKLAAEETVVEAVHRNLVPWPWTHSASPFTACMHQSHPTPRPCAVRLTLCWAPWTTAQILQ